MMQDSSRPKEKNKKNILHLAADLFINKGHPRLAVLTLERAARRTNDPKLVAALANAHAIAGDWNAAIGILVANVARMPEDLDLRRLLSVYQLAQFRSDKALPHLKWIVDHWPEERGLPGLASTQALLAQCYLVSNQLQVAEGLLQDAMRNAPWDLDACKGLIDLYRFTDRLEQVPGLLNDYIESYSSPYPPYVWLAHHTHYYLYQPKNALQWYLKALERISDPEIRRYCEHFYAARGMPANILNDYVRALIVSGENIEKAALVELIKQLGGKNLVSLQYHLASYYLMREDYQQLEKAATRALKVDKNDPEFWCFHALARSNQGDFEEAYRSIERALLLDPCSVLGLETLGSIQEGQNRWETALMTYQRLQEMQPLAPYWLRNLGTCHAKLDHMDQAVRFLKEAVRLRPLNAKAWLDLADVYNRLGRPEPARQACQRAIESGLLDKEGQEKADKILQDIDSQPSKD